MGLPRISDIPDRRRIVQRKALLRTLSTIADETRDPTRARPLVLDACRTALDRGRKEILHRLHTGERGPDSGAYCLAETSFLIDGLISALFEFTHDRLFAVANPTAAEQLSIVAVGGYGRRELSPQSDLDLLFLLPYKRTAQAEQITEFLLYVLWDLGLTVGHAVRSVDDCVRRARRDMTIRTTVLEMRLIGGDRRLFADLRKRVDKEVLTDKPRAFIDAKLSERDQRHRKMGDSRYVLEPNIKDGKGGLRDLHTLFWIARCIYRADNWESLIKRGLIDAAEAERFDSAQQFLWTLRCHLHAITERPEDRLTFDLQPELARRLGYSDRIGTSAVERFMKHYFLVAKEVGDLTRIFLDALDREFGVSTLDRVASALLRRQVGDFVIERGRMAMTSPQQFRDDPAAMIRIFTAAHRHRVDIDPNTLRAMQPHLKRIGKNVRQDPDANAAFLELLTAERNAETMLRRMSEAGVLGRFVPDFGRVVAQMQFDMYHVYTTDEHTLRAIGMLQQLEAGKLDAELPLQSRLIRQIDSRRALYVALLLHDIAKGRGGDHSVKGAAVARKLCPRLGLSAEETETVAWLVRWHLAMSHIAFRHDLDDPDTVRSFVKLVQSPERLNLLTILTALDIRAVGPGRWNGWKASLIAQLHARSEEIMAGGLFAEGRQRQIEAAQRALAHSLAEWSPEAVEALIDGLPDSYWLAFDTDAMSDHAALLTAFEQSDEQVMITAERQKARGATAITIITADRPGLFSMLTGALALSGASVLDARITTTRQQQALDVFWVSGPKGKDFTSKSWTDGLQKTVRQVIEGRLDPAATLERLQDSAPSRARAMPAPARVMINNQLNSEYTVIEVNGRDRPGLLYALARVLAEHRTKIALARVSTFGGRIVDVFYVKDARGLKLEHRRAIAELRASLLSVLEPKEHESETRKAA